MLQKRVLIAGIEIEKHMVQISYYGDNSEEPVTLFAESKSDTGIIEAVAYKYKGENKWCFGEAGTKLFEEESVIKEASFIEAMADDINISVDGQVYDPKDIFSAFLQYVMSYVSEACGGMTPDVIAVCTAIYNKSFLDKVKYVIKAAYPEADILFYNKDEALVYYAYSVDEELCRNDIALFEYNDNELIVRKVRKPDLKNESIVSVTSEKYAAEPDNTDEFLTVTAKNELGKDIYSAVYITGNNFIGMEYPEFVKYICSRRRAFAGQNLFSKGICYAAYEYIFNNKNIITITGADNAGYNVYIDVIEKGQQRQYRMVRGGMGWYSCMAQVDFIVCGNAYPVISLENVVTGSVSKTQIDLSSVKLRTDRTMRLGISIEYEGKYDIIVSVTDRGFGNIYRPVFDKTVHKISIKEG